MLAPDALAAVLLLGILYLAGVAVRRAILRRRGGTVDMSVWCGTDCSASLRVRGERYAAEASSSPADDSRSAPKR